MPIPESAGSFSSNLEQQLQPADILPDAVAAASRLALGETNILTERAELQDSLTNAYRQQFTPPLAVTSQSKMPKIPLDQMPVLQRALSRLGIPEELTNKMYSVWSAYRGLDVIKGRVQQPLSAFSEVETEVAAEWQAQAMLRRFSGVQSYVRKYGVDELVTVHETFGTTKFSAIMTEQLHDQLMRWQDPRIPVKDVGVMASEDWNEKLSLSDLAAAMSTIGKKLRRLVGRPNTTFLFEAGDSVALSKVPINVGMRERQAGREPDVGSVFIYAHGGTVPGGGGFITLGRKEWLTSEDYEDAAFARDEIAAVAQKAAEANPNYIPKDQVRLNDYTRHLGPNYEVVLLGCNTAAVTQGGTSTVEAINAGHNVKTTGSHGTYTYSDRSLTGRTRYYSLHPSDDPYAVTLSRLDSIR